VFTKATRPVLNEEQGQAVDDDFFGSRPMEYFADADEALSEPTDDVHDWRGASRYLD